MKRVFGYRKDLAFIHDRGFSDFSLEAAAGLLNILRTPPLPMKHVVELGCGSGRLAQVLLRKGFSVTGIDSSSSMISLAMRNAPEGGFSVRSLWDYNIPPCGAVMSVGEVLNYQFDRTISPRRLERFLSRVYNALLPSGLFVYDILCQRNSQGVMRTKSFIESDSWFIAVEKSDTSDSVTRRILSFRKQNGSYSRSVEVHKVRRYDLTNLTRAMRSVGFNVITRRGYRKLLGDGHVVVIGRKPAG